ncbi:MAG: S8 family serine peptidase, partial [Bacteroidetes bacterium]|nr:S8 family serine peptidase [Bacteroidota bacterium]
IHSIERVYPFLDHVEPTPKTRQNILALRRTYYVRYHAKIEPEQVVKDLSKADGVIYAEPVGIQRTLTYHQSTIPNDPLYANQTELQQLRIPEAWNVIKAEDGSPRVVIAIVDSGANWKHEDLIGNVWTNPNEIPDNGIDDDNNGFIDDVHGVNFANGDDTNNDPTNFYDYNHGTIVAGAVGAMADNDIGIAGAAWNAEIMHIDASFNSRVTGGFGYEGILYAAANGADIINTSWGSISRRVRSRFQNETLDLATDLGALIVAAAGNESRNWALLSPASHPRVLSVGATQKNTRKLTGFTNYGENVSVFAPGSGVWTTGLKGGYRTASGTSLASPLVAGIAALVKTKHTDWTPDMIREHIRLTSENIDRDNPSYTGEMGHGFVNALKAVQEIPSSPAVRLINSNWTDNDGDFIISPGDSVTVKATLTNYLIDAHQLRISIAEIGLYPFLNWQTREVSVGFLGKGDSVTVEFEFQVAPNSPTNQLTRFLVQVQDGAFLDIAGLLYMSVNQSVADLHQVLRALYVSTNGDQWDSNSGWDVNGTMPERIRCAGWHGLSCRDGILIGIDLSRNSLTGQLPPELGNLAMLRSLDLSDNQLSGPIPSELGNLTNLKNLNLWRNKLTGSILSELENLANLEYLNLGRNQLTGPIPLELRNLVTLEQLGLHSNQLIGPILPELGDLVNLKLLRVWGNQLTGPIPPELGDLTGLKTMGLHSNQLMGEIPPELGNLINLEWLDLYNNQLSGSIPRSFLQLQGLSILRFNGNSGLCAPSNDEFQAWLSMIQTVAGPRCTPSVSIEQKTVLPTEFTLQGNYPNPFRTSTRIQFDLPHPARVAVEVLDVTGRRTLLLSPIDVSAGWNREINLRNLSLPSGTYLYRLIVDSPDGNSLHTGRFIRVR